jgi:hypothetical protein
MKYCLTLLLLASSCLLFAQSEPSFCDAYTNSSYYTMLDSKTVKWETTHYVEEYRGTAVYNNKTYYKYSQVWSNGKVDNLYLREEDGRILQYESCCNEETVRYDEFFEPGHQWQSARKNLTYTLLSYNDMLTTPYCSYSNLMSIKAQYSNGSYYTFYYQQGNGYVGCKDANGKLMSYIMPPQ